MVPYLNITAQWDGAPDQGLLQPKGGRGFPYCAVMNSEGEVIWEVRPTDEAAFEKGLSHAMLLQKLKKRAAENPGDAGLKASVAILSAIGCEQREKPSVGELDVMAKTARIEPEVMTAFETWRKSEQFREAAYAMRDDGGKAAYELFKSGTAPDGEDDRLQFMFYRTALEGAIAAKDAKVASQLLPRFEKSMKDEKWKDWLKEQVADYEKRIAELK